MQPDKPVNFALSIVVDELRRYDTIKITPELLAWASLGVLALLGLVACVLYLVEHHRHGHRH